LSVAAPRSLPPRPAVASRPRVVLGTAKEARKRAVSADPEGVDGHRSGPTGGGGDGDDENPSAQKRPRVTDTVPSLPSPSPSLPSPSLPPSLPPRAATITRSVRGWDAEAYTDASNARLFLASHPAHACAPDAHDTKAALIAAADLANRHQDDPLHWAHAHGLPERDLEALRQCLRVGCVDARDYERATRAAVAREWVGVAAPLSADQRAHSDASTYSYLAAVRRDQRSRPTGERSSPTGERSRPTGERSRPTGERSRPTGERSSPTGERSRPTGERSRPTGERSRPTGERSSPTGERSSPTGDGAVDASGSPVGCFATRARIAADWASLEAYPDVSSVRAAFWRCAILPSMRRYYPSTVPRSSPSPFSAWVVPPPLPPPTRAHAT
jgi:hypothetical protein